MWGVAREAAGAHRAVKVGLVRLFLEAFNSSPGTYWDIFGGILQSLTGIMGGWGTYKMAVISGEFKSQIKIDSRIVIRRPNWS